MPVRALIVAVMTVVSLFLFSLLSGMPVFAMNSNGDSLNINQGGTTSLAATPHALSPSLTFNGDVPYITWAEVDANGVSRVYVRHQKGQEWVLDGGPLNQSLTGHAASPSLAVAGGHLYAAWSEINAKHVSQVYVKEWDGDKWASVGESLNINPTGSASSPVLSGNTAALYAAWTEVNPSGASLLYVKQWDGKSWTFLGETHMPLQDTKENENVIPAQAGIQNAGRGLDSHFRGNDGQNEGLNRNTKKHAMTPSLAANKDGVYLAWAEYDAQGIAGVYVDHWNGERWGPVGEAVNIDSGRNALSPSLSMAGSSPYVAWMEYDDKGVSQIYVKRWDGKEWGLMGSSLNINSSMSATVPSLCTKGTIPYVSWTEVGDNGVPALYVKQWKRNSWIQTEGPLNVDTGRAAAAPSIAIKDNTLYAAFTELDQRGIYQLYVRELTDSDISHSAPKTGSEISPSPAASQTGDKKERKFFTSMPKDPAAKAKELPPPLAFKYLPRTSMGEINWMAGIRGGVLKPFDSTDPEARSSSPLQLEIPLPVKKEFGIPDVLFPHSSHTMWLDCRNCHPTIFAPKRAGNPITMHRILEGEYCGRCHGVVAFRLYDCFRCHAGAP